MVVATEQLYTLEEFWALPDETTRGCELIDGRIVKKHNWDGEEQGITRDMATHMRVIRLIWRALDDAAEQAGVGAAYTEPTHPHREGPAVDSVARTSRQSTASCQTMTMRSGRWRLRWQWK